MNESHNSPVVWTLPKVPLRRSIFDEADEYQFAQELGDIENKLIVYGKIWRDELPKEVAHFNWAVSYSYDVKNGGHEQFLGNCGPAADRAALDALLAIGAKAQAEILTEVVAYWDADASRRVAAAARRGFEHPVHGRPDEWIKQRNSRFYELEKAASLVSIAATWLRTKASIYPIDDPQWKYAMNEAIESNPHRAERLQGREPDDFITKLFKFAPFKMTFFQYAQSLATPHGITLPNWPKHTWTERGRSGEELWCHLFETEGGPHLVIFVNKEEVVLSKCTPNGERRFKPILPLLGHIRMERVDV